MRKTILIVEDEAALLYALQSQLAAEGYQVLTADDGEKALKMVNTYHPAAIVLDIVLPKINGWQFLETIKTNMETKEIPVIIISNLSDDSSRQRGTDLGAIAYLPKINYSIVELVDKIKTLLK